MADTGNVISIREFYKVDVFTTRPFKGNPLKFVTSRQQQMPLCGDATIASLCVLKLKGLSDRKSDQKRASRTPMVHE